MSRSTQKRLRGAKRGKADVLRAILEREAAGLPLNHAAVLSNDRQLHADALRLFCRWNDALLAAGIDPARIWRHRQWNRRVVVKRIMQLAAQGTALNPRAVQMTEATLASAIYRYFASWNEALQAAGLDPDDWRRRVPNWTRARVIKSIRSIRCQGGMLNHAAVRGNSLSRAAVKLFGSWDAALQAAGIDPNTVRVYRKPWTPEELLKEIRRKHDTGEALNAKDVSPNWIRRSACLLFGSWDATLIAAGLDPSQIRRNHRRGQ